MGSHVLTDSAHISKDPSIANFERKTMLSLNVGEHIKIYSEFNTYNLVDALDVRTYFNATVYFLAG